MKISTALTACGSKETVSPVTEAGTAIQAVETTAAEKEEIPAVEIEDAAKSAETEESIKEIYFPFFKRNKRSPCIMSAAMPIVLFEQQLCSCEWQRNSSVFH